MAGPVETLLRAMEGWRASDLFLFEGRTPAVRVDGAVRGIQYALTTRADIESVLDVIPNARARFDRDGDLDCGYTLEDGRRYRLNVARAQGRLTLVARSLPVGDLSFTELRLPDAVRALCEAPRGLVLVAGATGSGKSTTLAAMVHHLNSTRAAHIVTIEDPIEFVHRDIRSRVTQREIGSDTPSFASALREVVRQSPDVLLIGEMRDAESMQVALSAALTGHLVFATLHTVDATQTLQRILAYYPEHLRNQAALDLSLALRGIVCQRLLPRKDGGGRVVAVEMLTSSPPVQRLLREQRVDELVDLMRSDPGAGMVTFNESLIRMYREGLISFETGQASATNPEEFSLWAKGMAGSLDPVRSRAGERAGLDIRSLLETVLEMGASDLHLTVGRPPILRISGQLRPMGGGPLSDADVRMLLFSILSTKQRSIYELEHEVDFALSLQDGQRFRVNAYFQKGRYAAALRAISSKIPDAAELRLPEMVLRLAERPHGLLLVVGPTGAGKSTTLACLVDRINRTRACRIITVEDPIEYVHDGVLATVDQREVHSDTDSFSTALKYVLRQDPDVILVGEMRDLETVSAALTAAETGHLVLATLHTNDAVQAIDRIIDVFPPHQQTQVRSQLSSSLLGVVSQRLLARKDGIGRIGAFEVMVGTSAIRNLVREGKLHQAYGVMEASRKDGCNTMDQALQELLSADLITQDEAMRFLRTPVTKRML